MLPISNGMNIIGNKHIFLALSGITIIASLAAIVAYGFREGIDFRGGTLWEMRLPDYSGNSQAVEEDLRAALGTSEIRVSYDAANKSFLVRLPVLQEADHQDYLLKVKSKFTKVEELGFQSIGPSVGAELRKDSLLAILLVLIGISLYIAFAFRRVFRPISSWRYGLVTLVTLFHDVIIPAGLLAYLGETKGVEIDGNFVVALLVIMGFSVHDTIVVFDRIRENLALDRGKASFAEVINQSVNQTLARSVNTSLTLILVLIALYVAGPTILSYFILTLLIGVTVGIYSSIFVASPLLLVWQRFSSR